MKRIYVILALVFCTALAGSASCAAVVPAAAPPQAFGAALDIGFCYDYLAPYGSWIEFDPYGYVWCPRHMGYGWRPYSEGRWLWTDDGWCWDSDLDWGWMPFHYGRWGWDDDCGWFWVPGTAGGPAWVFWRFGDLYCGWAPMPPGLNFRAGIDFDAFAIGLPLNYWCFVDGRHFLDRDIRSYVLPYERNGAAVRLTELRNRYDFRGGRMIDQGIDPEAIHRVSGRPVTRYAIANADRPGGPRLAGNQIRVFRPEIRESARARPKRFVTREQARREMGAARVFEPRPNARTASPESELRKGQARERQRLEQSQSQERQNLEKAKAAAARKMTGQAEHAKIEQEYRARMAEQQKRHQAERQQIAERHRAEAERVRKAAPSKPAPKRRDGRRT
jgi:hypothetical protein